MHADSAQTVNNGRRANVAGLANIRMIRYLVDCSRRFKLAGFALGGIESAFELTLFLLKGEIQTVSGRPAPSSETQL